MGIANGKKKLQELEDELLRLLNETKGSLLEDENLFVTLQTSKATSAVRLSYFFLYIILNIA